MAEEKAHKPTERRKRDARKEGNVLKSPLFSSACATLGVLLGALLSGAILWINSEMLLQSWSNADVLEVSGTALGAFRTAFLLTVIPLVLGGAFGVFAEVLQVGWRVEFSLLGLKLERLNPVSGMGRLGSGLKQIWLPLLKILLVGLFFSFFLRWFFTRFPQSFFLPPADSFAQMGAVALSVCAGTVVLLFLLAAIEFVVKRKEYLKELSMSDYEVRKEMKDDEGDPYVRGKQRALRQELLTGEIVKRVKRSAVIIVERRSSLE